MNSEEQASIESISNESSPKPQTRTARKPRYAIGKTKSVAHASSFMSRARRNSVHDFFFFLISRVIFMSISSSFFFFFYFFKKNCLDFRIQLTAGETINDDAEESAPAPSTPEVHNTLSAQMR